MKKLLVRLLILTNLTLFSCGNDFIEYQDRVSSITDVEKNIENLIVIPGEGCGGCISNATFIVIENIDKLIGTQIIFTGVEDKKLLRNQLGTSFLNRENVIIDIQNLLMEKEVLSFYPYILINENNRIKDKIILDQQSFDRTFLDID